MNTWKNNNVLTRIKESYFSEDTDRDEDDELPPGAKLVGGTIFYIDDTADGEYQFFDFEGNEIENIQVGERPYAYRVVSRGSKDKYYVYSDRIYEGRWSNYDAEEGEDEPLDTLESIGSGRTNTAEAMSKSNSFGRYPTIWQRLQWARRTKINGCDDWFVPSKDELEELRLAIESGSITGGTIAGSSYDGSVFKREYLWSSSEHPSQGAWLWSYYYRRWGNYYKYEDNSVLFTRAF